MRTLKLLCFLSILAPFNTCKAQDENKVFNPASPSELVSTIGFIYQDEKDNYWFSTNGNGLFKFDGKKLRRFTQKDGVCGDNILSIQEDHQGNIYFDTPNAVCKYDGLKFSTLEVIENDSAQNSWKLEPTDLWFRMGWGSNGGPFRYDGKHLYQLQFPKNDVEDELYSKYPNLSYNPYGVYYIYKDSKGNIWFGTSNLGIYRYDGKTIRWMFEKQLTDTPAGGSFGIRSIIEDKNGYFWICNANFKYKILPDSAKTDGLNPINYKREPGIKTTDLENLYFLSITADDKGDLWMLSYDDGVWRNNGKELIHYPIKDGERNILLSTIHTDNKGAIWVSTRNEGLYRLKGDVFEKFRL